MRRSRLQEMEFLNIVSDVTGKIELAKLLARVMGEATRMLKAERSTLFLNDEKTNELFSRTAQGGSVGEIRLPNHLGIAGAVFQSGDTVNFPHAYADLRFNPAFDKQTGFFTRSILCVPVANKTGKMIGVTQVLNRKGGPFTDEATDPRPPLRPWPATDIWKRRRGSGGAGRQVRVRQGRAGRHRGAQ
jgi:adenylate cyclase